MEILLQDGGYLERIFCMSGAWSRKSQTVNNLDLDFFYIFHLTMQGRSIAPPSLTQNTALTVSGLLRLLPNSSAHSKFIIIIFFLLYFNNFCLLFSIPQIYIFFWQKYSIRHD